MMGKWERYRKNNGNMMEHFENSSENQDGSLVATSCLKCPFRARSKSMRRQTPPKTTKPIFSYLFHADSHYPLNDSASFEGGWCLLFGR